MLRFQCAARARLAFAPSSACASTPVRSLHASARACKVYDPEWDGEEVLPYSHVFDNGWSKDSQRTGVLGIKLGMTHDWDKWGRRWPLTVIQVKDCQVTRVSQQPDEYHNRIQLGCGDFTPQPKGQRGYVNRARTGVFKALGMENKRHLRDFRITNRAIVPVGTRLYAQHFIPGQYVDIQGVSNGKGFAGVMKKWGMKGGPASHGATKSHRKMGGTGGSTSPGRVLPGKHMAGRMGNEKRWVRSLWVFKINTKYNLLFVKGAVPGRKGNVVKVIDAVRWHPSDPILPFPTFVPEEGVEYEEELYAPRPDIDVISPDVRGRFILTGEPDSRNRASAPRISEVSTFTVSNDPPVIES